MSPFEPAMVEDPRVAYVADAMLRQALETGSGDVMYDMYDLAIAAVEALDVYDAGHPEAPPAHPPPGHTLRPDPRTEKRMNDNQRSAGAKAVAAMFAEIARHDGHTWEQVGRCVYCDDCGQRLYQGRILDEHTKVKTRRAYDDALDPKATRSMRDRWGKDQ